MVRFLYILVAILMLGFIVTMHEFGHYLVGRLCGIGIIEFSVGFGPKLIGFERKGIKYSLRCVPLGGYCSFVGEDENNKAPNAMNNQPIWKRFLTVLAGPAMNFILAFLFCVILLTCFSTAEYLPRISYIEPELPAAQCGIQLGDVITSINGNPVSYDQNGISTISGTIRSGESESVTLMVDRHGESIELNVSPRAVVNENTGETVYQIGISFGGRHYTVPEALSHSCTFMVEFTGEMLKSLKDLIFHGQGVDGMMGPVGIVNFVSDYVYNEQLYAVVYLIFFLSLNIGIMNLLPLPALDGGRLVFLIVEGIRRKPIPPEKEGFAHMIGFSLLLMLIVFVTYKDIIRLITGG